MGAIVRILLRYVAGALVAKGVFSPELGDFITADPEIEMAVQIGLGILIGAITEYAYALAKRWGWAT